MAPGEGFEAPANARPRRGSAQRVIAPLKAQWEDLKAGKPGRRFREHRAHERAAGRGGGWRRGLNLALAVVAFAIGVVLVFVPGPAVLFFVLAGALLAGESTWVARGLDAGEVGLRRMGARGAAVWCTLAWPGRVALVTLALAIAAAVGWCGYRFFWA